MSHLYSKSRVCSVEHDASRTYLVYLLLGSPSMTTRIVQRIRKVNSISSVFLNFIVPIIPLEWVQSQ